MKDSIVVKLPYPHKFFGLTISKNRNIGFLFTNLSMFLFRENNNLKTSDDYNAWIKSNGENGLLTEMMFAAAQAYCMDLRLKQTFSKSKLIQAISISDTEIQKSIIEAWRRSQSFGVVESKKKPKLKR